MSVRQLERNILSARDTDCHQVEQAIVKLHRIAPLGYAWAGASDRIDSTIADTVADLVPHLREWYPYISIQDTVINLVTYAQLAYPDIPINGSFYSGNEKAIMRKVVRGNTAHTKFLGSLFQYGDENINSILQHFSTAFLNTPREAYAFNPNALFFLIPKETQYYAIWHFGHAIFDSINQPIKLFNSWLSIPRTMGKTNLIAQNLERLIEIYADSSLLIREMQKKLHISQFGKFDLKTLRSALNEIKSTKQRDIMFSFISPEIDKDLILDDANALLCDISDLQIDSMDCGFLAFEFRSADELRDELALTLRKTKKQAIIILDGHSNKNFYSDISTQELTDIILSVKPSDNRIITIIFIACSTGIRQGIAFEISRHGIHTIAPNKDTWVYQLTLTQSDDCLLSPHVVFTHGQTAEYFNGKEIARYED